MYCAYACSDKDLDSFVLITSVFLRKICDISKSPPVLRRVPGKSRCVIYPEGVRFPFDFVTLFSEKYYRNKTADER